MIVSFYTENVFFKYLEQHVIKDKQKLGNRTSDQDGGRGRHTLPPHTTIRRITTNVKTKNNQNCQKIKLYRRPIIKELKKHSPRQVGGAEMGRRSREDTEKWRLADRVVYICMWINRGTTG